ncbi:MAG: hypothetical protein CVV50_05375 [Spirochaetae bacterium HGW-Spirochaetae-6]|nr:MAG: hypothetical protein CVV50_05375 [Spirochaetae bacterium HGW-Spirochaetae-6]
MRRVKKILGILLLLSLTHCSRSCQSVFSDPDYYDVDIKVTGQGGAVIADIKWEIQDHDEHQAYVNRFLPWSKSATRIYEGQVCLAVTNKSGVGTVHVEYKTYLYSYDDSLYEDNPYTEEDESSGGYVLESTQTYNYSDAKTVAFCDYW